MSNRRPRILIVSYTVPENVMGGGLLLHRHFIERDDYEVGVVTNNPARTLLEFHRYVPESALLSRMRRTRLSLWFNDYRHLVLPHVSDRRLLRAAQEFSPDLILNVAETYLSHQALKLARKLGVPFACYFMDWANYSSSQHGWAIPVMDRMYRSLYRHSDLAICISEGMRDELGEHSNVTVVYPIASPAPKVSSPSAALAGRTAFNFTFAGNLAHWYGRQIAGILNGIEKDTSIHLDVYGAYHQWSIEFEDRQIDLGAYHGLVKFEELVPVFQHTDGFLLTMGFDESSALIERTSFKTKLLDYLQYEKPILIWGPESCTAVRVARKFNAAYCVTDSEPAAVVNGMKELAADASLQRKLVMNASKMRDQIFDPTAIYAKLKLALDELAQWKNASGLPPGDTQGKFVGVE